MKPISIDLYSDVVCPWCFIGSTRLDRVLAAYPGEVTVVHKPFMLRPDAPAAGIDIADMLRKRTGREPKELFASAEAAARESGLTLDLARQPRMYPTANAHTLLRHAQAKGTQHALAQALFSAYFNDAKKISDPAVLAELALPHGFSADETARLLADPAELNATQRAAEQASALGIRGVPFFVFDGKLAVSGAQPEAVLRQALEQAAS